MVQGLHPMIVNEEKDFLRGMRGRLAQQANQGTQKDNRQLISERKKPEGMNFSARSNSMACQVDNTQQGPENSHFLRL